MGDLTISVSHPRFLLKCYSLWFSKYCQKMGGKALHSRVFLWNLAPMSHFCLYSLIFFFQQWKYVLITSTIQRKMLAHSLLRLWASCQGLNILVAPKLSWGNFNLIFFVFQGDYSKPLFSCWKIKNDRHD